MEKTAIKILNQLESNGFEAYIVGGYVRDKVLGIESTDIDITTSATFKDIIKIFPETKVIRNSFLGMNLTYENFDFTITSFRKDSSIDKRKPKVNYTTSLKADLLRRDFYMNTLCLDKNMKIIDLLEGLKDIALKEINVVGDASKSFKEDPLRILRAIRLATVLGFNLGAETKKGIIKNKKRLKKLSFERKKEELDKIFSSSNIMEGVLFIEELDLARYLDIYDLKNVSKDTDLIGVWASLEVSDKYPFTKNEKRLIEDIHTFLKLEMFDEYNLYKYGLYVAKTAASIKKIDPEEIQEAYLKLPIKNFTEIVVSAEDIMKTLKKGAGPYIKEVFDDIEKKIIYNKLENNHKKIIEYIKRTYL